MTSMEAIAFLVGALEAPAVSAIDLVLLCVVGVHRSYLR
jgi:hypothetical protein